MPALHARAADAPAGREQFGVGLEAGLAAVLQRAGDIADYVQRVGNRIHG